MWKIATCKKDDWGNYIITVNLPKSHPHFTRDVNPDSQWYIALDVYVHPLIQGDELVLTTTVHRENAQKTLDALWEFCNNPKSKPIKLQTPLIETDAESFAHYAQDPEYLQYSGKLCYFCNRTTIIYSSEIDPLYTLSVVEISLLHYHNKTAYLYLYLLVFPM